MIVSLGGATLAESRVCAHRFIERTSGATSLDDVGRARDIPAHVIKLERARMREKVRGTNALRARVAAVLDAWRSQVLHAIGLREDAADDASATATATQALLSRIDRALALMDPQKLASEISSIQAQLYQLGLKSAAKEVGLSFDLAPERGLLAMQHENLVFARAIVQRQMIAIKDALLAGLDAGDGVAQIGDRIRDVFDDGMHIIGADGTVARVIPQDSWIEQVARTEVSRAMNNGIFDVYRAAGVAQVMWVAAEDERTCPLCDTADGTIVPIGQPFPGVEVPNSPGHVLCCPPGTKISTPEGSVPIERIAVGDRVLTHRGRYRPVVGLSRREVAEPLLTIRAGDRVLRVTGNHPILTLDGWTRAASLKVSDHVYRVDTETVLRTPLQANDLPPVGREKGLLGRILGALMGGGVPFPAVNFDGKSSLGQRNVDIELSHGVVRDGGNAPSGERGENDHLVDRSWSPLHRSRTSLEFALRSRLAPNAVVGGAREFEPFSSRSSLHPHVHRLATGARMESQAQETSVDGRPGDTVRGGERLEAGAGDVLVVDSAAPFVGESAGRHTAIVPIDAIECTNYEGVVYNFEVADDESYVADGIIVHNCRCTTVSAGFARGSDAAAA